MQVGVVAVKKLGVIAVCLLLSNSTLGQFRDGNKLYSELEVCAENSTFTCGFAWGYLTGVFDLNLDLQKIMKIYGEEYFKFSCPPAGITIQQLVDVVAAYLKANPAVRHRRANSIVEDAILDAWPCPDNQQ